MYVTTAERFLQDVCYSLRVYFPTYRIDSEIEVMPHAPFATLHLSSDGRDRWLELVPDREGVEREIALESMHMRFEMPLYMFEDAQRVQHFRRSTIERFTHEWFTRRMRAAGIEP